MEILIPQWRHSNVEYFTSRTAGAVLMRPPEREVIHRSCVSKVEFFRPHTMDDKLLRGNVCLPKIDLGLADGSEVEEPKPWERIDVRKLGVVRYQGDKKGKKCEMFFYGGKLPLTHETDHGQIIKYMKEILEKHQRVSFVYFHHGVTRDCQVPVPVLLEGISELSEKYSSKIDRIYIIQMELPQIALNPILALLKRRFPSTQLFCMDRLKQCPRWLKKAFTPQMIAYDRQKDKKVSKIICCCKVTPVSNPALPPCEPAPVKRQEPSQPPKIKALKAPNDCFKPTPSELPRSYQQEGLYQTPRVIPTPAINLPGTVTSD